jgi:DNA-binding transcriptional MerR regulator/effector-binding domain-containing protein
MCKHGVPDREGFMDHKAMLSIKAFADFTGISESTLRYYDKIGLLSPEFRGANKYRYYSPLQTITVDFIKVLTKVGVPLSTIRDMHKGRTPQSVLALLRKQENALDERLFELQTAYSIIHTYCNNIETGLVSKPHDISVQKLDAVRIILGPETDFGNAKTFYAPFMKFCDAASKNKIDLHYPIGGYHENIELFLDAPGRPTRWFSQDPRGNSQRSPGRYLVAYHQGYYGEFEGIPQRLVAYTQANNLVFTGPVYVIYLLDEISVVDHKQYVSQIAVGVSNR